MKSIITRSQEKLVEDCKVKLLLLISYFNNFLVTFCVDGWGGVLMSYCTCRGQRTTHGSQFSTTRLSALVISELPAEPFHQSQVITLKLFLRSGEKVQHS